MKCALVRCEKNLRLVDAILATIVDASLKRERRQHEMQLRIVRTYIGRAQS